MSEKQTKDENKKRQQKALEDKRAQALRANLLKRKVAKPNNSVDN